MSIEINRAWLTNADGTDCVPTNQMIACNTSQLAEDMKHKSYNAARILYWYADYDTNTTPSDLTDEVKTMCRSALSRENEMFDYSFCWAGLGEESFLSNVKYVCYGDIITGQGTEPQVYQNHDYNTPWSFDLYLNDGANKNYQFLTFNYNGMSDSNTKANRIRCYCWKNTADENPNNPQAYWTSSGGGSGYYCTALRPIHKIALKNWINLIIVIAKQGYGYNYTGVRAFDLYTYCNTNVHENYPCIVMVSLVPMMKTNTSGNNRQIIGYGDTNTNPRLSLTTYTQPAMSGELAYSSSASGHPKVYYPDSTWRQGMFIGGYFQGSGNTPAYGGSTNFLCNDNTTHSVYISANIPIMGAMIGEQGDGAGNLQYKTQLKTIFELGDDKWEEKKWSWSGNDYLCYCRLYDDDFYDECLTQAACFGMFFTDRYTVAYNGELYDENMYLGTLDDNNIGHGLYTKGLKNASQKQWDWTDSSDSDYDPNYNPDPEFPEDYSGVVTKVPPTGISRGGKWYILNGSDYGTHFNEFLNDVSTSQAEIYQLEPIQCVISSKVVMCPDFFGIPASVDTGRIILGTHAFPESGVYSSVYAFANCYPETYISETKRVLELYHDFRDYEPYTKVSIYLPFAGNIEIPTNMVMNRHVHYEETIDPISGDLRYVIYIDGVPFTSVTGNCSFDLDINGEQSSLYRQSQLTLQHQRQDNQYNTLKSVAGNVVGASIAAKLKNPLGSKAQYVSGGISLAQGYFTDKYIEAQLDHSEPQPIQMAKTTSNCEYGDIILPCIAVTRPRMVDGYTDDYFRKTNGFKTFIYSTVGQQKYFVQCSNVHMSGLNCTTEESAMIKKLLESGIYIKEE